MRGLFLLVVPALLLAKIAPVKPIAGDTAQAASIKIPATTTPALPVSSQLPQDSKAKDSLAVVPPKSRSDTVIVAKHAFDHREQIITGSVIMSCLVLMLVAMNNYNPR